MNHLNLKLHLFQAKHLFPSCFLHNPNTLHLSLNWLNFTKDNLELEVAILQGASDMNKIVHLRYINIVPTLGQGFQELPPWVFPVYGLPSDDTTLVRQR